MSRHTLLVALLFFLGMLSLSAAAYLFLYQRDEAALAAAGVEPAAVSPTTAVNATAVASPTTSLAPQPTATPRSTLTAVPQTITVTIVEGAQRRTLQTGAATVGALLAEVGLALGEQDVVDPSPETPLQEGMELQVRRAIPLTIQVDGQSLAIVSGARTTAEALANAGIVLGELDLATPGLAKPLQAGEVIQVVRVREELLVEDTQVPYQTVYQPSDQLDLDTKAVLSSGTPGILRSSTRVRYEDGVEVSRVVEREWFEPEPVNEVIGYGTRITTNVIDTPEGVREYWRVVRMRVTAYTAASSGKSPDHPSYGITASGLPAGTGIVAVDPNVIPFRSEVYVPGYGIGFAGDTGGGIKGRWIDLGYDEEELQAWNGYVDVYYLTPIPSEINYLLPEVLP